MMVWYNMVMANKKDEKSTEETTELTIAEAAEVDGTATEPTKPVAEPIPEITWEAEEYIVHEKNSWWYVGLVAVALVLVGLAVLLQAWTFLAVVVLSVIALVVYTLRPPRVLHYSLGKEGLREDQRLYPYADFKSFGLLHEGQHFAIVLTPRKRFAPRITVFFPETQGEKIVDAFGARLPMEEVKLDLLDKLIKFLRI